MNPARRGLTFFAAFSAGVFAWVYLPDVGAWTWLGFSLLLPAGFFLRRRRTAGVLICLGVAAALLWCQCFRTVFFSPAERLDGRISRVSVVLAESGTASSYGGAYAPCWVVQKGIVPVRGTLCAGEELLALSPGDRVSALCECTKTALLEETRFTNASARGIFLQLNALGPLTVDRAVAVPWWCLPRQWGQRLSECLADALPGDVSGFLRAMVTGDKAGLDSFLKTDLARSGTSHIVAVSGMHVCFLVSLLTLFAGYEPRRRALICIPVMIFFALAVGAMPSVLRACLFQLTLLLADLLGREEDRWTTLTGALALLLLFDPFSAASISLQLSFSAVAGIAWLTPKIYARLEGFRFAETGPRQRRANWFLCRASQLFAASLGAMALTIPLSAYYFGAFSILAPLTNLLVLPAASLLFAGTLITGLLGLVCPALAGVVGAVPALLARYVLWVIRAAASVPFCAVTLRNAYYATALAILYLLAGLALFRRPEGRRIWLFLLCGAAVTAGSLLLNRLELYNVRSTVTVLDVGQGQCVVLTSKGETAVVDCGGNSREDPGDLCADYLSDRGAQHVDKLILTHCHDDHTNGLPALFRRMEVEEVILPDTHHAAGDEADILTLAEGEGTRVTRLEQDTDFILGEARITLYAPLGAGSANEACAAVRIQTGDAAVLITGDMDQSAEERLTAHAGLGRCRVLIAGHHGSGSASGDVLLSAVRPEIAVISVGANRYGHPSEETLARLARYGADIRRTDQGGAVTIRVN